MANLELELRFDDGKIICNAEQFKKELVESLKTYNYVVNSANYDLAKSDRASINKLVETVSTKRKNFAKKIKEEWTPYEKLLMDCEKIVKAVADELGKGIYEVDEKEKQEKQQEIIAYYNTKNMSDLIDFDLIFDPKWLNKSCSKKQWKEALDEVENKVEKDYQMLSLFLPHDMSEREQVLDVYYKTIDLGQAKAKADYLASIRQKVSQMPQMEAVEPKKEVEQPIVQKEEQEVLQAPLKQLHYVVEFIGDRAFFDDMNKIIVRHKAKVKILKKEEI